MILSNHVRGSFGALHYSTSFLMCIARAYRYSASQSLVSTLQGLGLNQVACKVGYWSACPVSSMLRQKLVRLGTSFGAGTRGTSSGGLAGHTPNYLSVLLFISPQR